MTPSIRNLSRFVGVVCAVLGTCGVVRAQSAVDGFNPGANGRPGPNGGVIAVAVQPDGKILANGRSPTWR